MIVITGSEWIGKTFLAQTLAIRYLERAENSSRIGGVFKLSNISGSGSIRETLKGSFYEELKKLLAVTDQMLDEMTNDSEVIGKMFTLASKNSSLQYVFILDAPEVLLTDPKNRLLNHLGSLLELRNVKVTSVPDNPLST